LGALLATTVLTAVVRDYSLNSGMLDLPNARSSHSRVTPRGGGLAIVIVVLVGAMLIWASRQWQLEAMLGWCLGGAAVAAVGIIDDRRGLSARSRLAVQLLAAVFVVWTAGGLPTLPAISGILNVPFIGAAVAVIGVIWSINLFNFMDGTDGVAACQTVFVAGTGATLAASYGPVTPNALMAWIVAAASLGFLLWNFPPAKIFMGDVGSGFLGLALAICALQLSWEGSVNLWTWMVLHALFLTDATVTLLVRLGRGERVYQAHRQHAYQRLARRWRSHGKVLALFCAINLCWLLPIAAITVRFPHQGPLLASLAMTPLCAGALMIGAGREG
jgi:Fuc2NAc and GlcNAc transferase